MKKLPIIISLLLSAWCLGSCEKNEESTWHRLYGYTKEDLIGQYEANPDTTCYAELPTEGVVVYPNATIDITPSGENSLRIHIVIPNVINKYFTGSVADNNSDSELIFHNYHEDIMITVYKDAQNQIRLHGHERRCRYNEDNEIIDCTYHGFDVIKTNDNP